MAVLPTSDEKYFGRAFLDDIVQWVGDNLDLDEVFLGAYVVEWVRDNMTPEKVFDDDGLDEWATKNGYVKEE